MEEKENQERTEQQLIDLCACAVNGTIPLPQQIEGMDLEAVYEMANRHMLTAVAGMALEAAGIQAEKFKKAIALAQMKNVLLDGDRARVLEALEQAGIWYLPLKGALLKDLYPRLGMRQMADNDILFDPERRQEVREIMEGLGFVTKDYGRENEDVYFREPVSSFEMHVHLINGRAEERLKVYYDDVKSRLIRDEGNQYGYHFSDEDFYLYLVAHEYKHYIQGGTGIRSLLDTYVYLKKKDTGLDWDYIRREAEKMGVADFEEKNRALAINLFDTGSLSAEEREMLDDFSSSGVYGTLARATEKEIAKTGRKQYFLSRLSLPHDQLVRNYPVLQKHGWLYPVIWVWRLISKFFSAHGRFMYQLKAALGITKTEE